MERVKTGIAKLDKLLGGGLLKNKVFLVTGEAGCGKTIFCLQFIFEGLKRGESAIYVAVEEKPEDVLEDASAMGWDLGQYVRAGKLIMLDASPYLSKVGEGKEIDVRRMMSDLSRHARENNARRLVIDPLGYLVDHATSSRVDKREYIRDLVFSLESSLGCTVLIASPIPRGSAESPYGMGEFVVSGIFILAIDENGKKPRRVLSIRKMRETQVYLSRHFFDIKIKKGIVVGRSL